MELTAIEQPQSIFSLLASPIPSESALDYFKYLVWLFSGMGEQLLLDYDRFAVIVLWDGKDFSLPHTVIISSGSSVQRYRITWDKERTWVASLLPPVVFS
jgi:hypothetical protein